MTDHPQEYFRIFLGKLNNLSPEETVIRLREKLVQMNLLMTATPASLEREVHRQIDDVTFYNKDEYDREFSFRMRKLSIQARRIRSGEIRLTYDDNNEVIIQGMTDTGRVEDGNVTVVCETTVRSCWRAVYNEARSIINAAIAYYDFVCVVRLINGGKLPVTVLPAPPDVESSLWTKHLQYIWGPQWAELWLKLAVPQAEAVAEIEQSV
jgi:hypothetical protein